MDETYTLAKPEHVRAIARRAAIAFAAEHGLATHGPQNSDGGFDSVPARRGLGESLEEYASRVLDYDVGITREAYADACAELRPTWRREGLRLLHVPAYADADTRSGLCACAPGVAVPTAFVDWPDDAPAPGECAGLA